MQLVPDPPMYTTIRERGARLPNFIKFLNNLRSMSYVLNFIKIIESKLNIKVKKFSFEIGGVVYKIPYRRALGLAAECAREKMYLSYKGAGGGWIT